MYEWADTLSRKRFHQGPLLSGTAHCFSVLTCSDQVIHQDTSPSTTASQSNLEAGIYEHTGVDFHHPTKYGYPLIKVLRESSMAVVFIDTDAALGPVTPSPSGRALQGGNNCPAFQAQLGLSEADRRPMTSSRAAQSGTSDEDLRHAVVEFVSEYGLHNAARAAWAVRSRSPFIQDKPNDDILAATQSYLQSPGFHRNFSAHPSHPLRLELIRNKLQLMKDPDIGPIDIAESGFHTGGVKPRRRQAAKTEETCLLKSTTQTSSQPKRTRTPCLASSTKHQH